MGSRLDSPSGFCRPPWVGLRLSARLWTFSGGSAARRGWVSDSALDFGPFFGGSAARRAVSLRLTGTRNPTLFWRLRRSSHLEVLRKFREFGISMVALRLSS